MSKIQFYQGRARRRSVKFGALCASVSSLVLGVSLAGSAMAACTGAAVTINGPASGAYTGANYNFDTGSTSNGGTFTTCPTSITVASGTAVVVTKYSYLGTVQNDGWVPIFNIGGHPSITGTSSQGYPSPVQTGPLNVLAGATLVFGGQQSTYGSPYNVYDSVLNAAGNVVFEGNGGFAGDNQYGLLGTNTMTGNVTLEAGANVRVGEYYSTVTTSAMGSYAAGGYFDGSTINFGANTNVSLQGAAGAGKDTSLYLNLNAPAVIGGYLAATTQSEVWLHAGALTVNGANTAANPFVGTLQLDPGTTFTVGDSTHAGAVFGDPNHTDGSTLTLNIARTTNGVDTLTGYGTIYATVNNSGVVTPGGTAGVLGSLTVSKYVQANTGILNIEVSPTGASELKVLGSASLAGTLNLKIDPGSYGNNVIQILSAGSISGSFSNINTSGAAAAGLAIQPTGYYVVTELTSSTQVFGHLVDADATHINAFADTLYDQLSDASPSNASKSDLGNGNGVWLQPYGSTSRLSNDGYGYNTTASGLTGGFIHQSQGAWNGPAGISNAAAGVAVSIGHEDLKTDANATRAGSNLFDGAVFAGFDLQNARVDGLFFYNTYKSGVVRNLGSSGVISSSPKATTEGGSLQISGALFDGQVVPYMRATYADIDQQALTEQGANLLALQVGEIKKTFFYSDLGVKLHPSVATVAGLHPEITLAVEHNFTYHPGDEVVGQFANLSGSPFTFNWKGDQATAGLVGLNLSSDVAAHLQVFGKLDGRFTIRGDSGDLRVGARYRF